MGSDFKEAELDRRCIMFTDNRITQALRGKVETRYKNGLIIPVSQHGHCYNNFVYIKNMIASDEPDDSLDVGPDLDIEYTALAVTGRTTGVYPTIEEAFAASETVTPEAGFQTRIIQEPVPKPRPKPTSAPRRPSWHVG